MPIISSLVFTCLLQTASAVKGPLDIVMPPMTRADFQEVVGRVAGASGKKDWERAKLLARRLPTTNPSIQLDLSEVPTPLKADFKAAILAGVTNWQKAVPGFSPTFVSTKGQIVFRFGANLGRNPESNLPRGAAFFLDRSKNQVLETVIALKRGDDQLPIQSEHVANETQYAIGSYLGLTDIPLTGDAMARNDLLPVIPSQISRFEGQVAIRILSLGQSIRMALAATRPIQSLPAKASIDPLEVSIPSVLQGQEIPFNIQLSNYGSGKLQFVTKADCACLFTENSGLVEPSSSILIGATILTKDLAGSVDRRVMVFTNDAERPVLLIRITTTVTPRYRVWAGPQNAIVLSEDQQFFDLYVQSLSATSFNVTSVAIAGVAAETEVSPWQGVWPESGKEETKGSRIRVKLSGEIPFGRGFAGVAISVDDPNVGVIRQAFTLQRGIAVLPMSLNFGELGNTPKTARVLLSRPGQPFKVVSAQVEGKLFKVSQSLLPDGTIAIEVRYDGSGIPGIIQDVILIKTDDYKQPTIRIPIRGIFR